MVYKQIKECRDKYNKEINWMKKIPLGDRQSKQDKKMQFELNEIRKDKKNRYMFYNNLLKAFNKKN